MQRLLELDHCLFQLSFAVQGDTERVMSGCAFRIQLKGSLQLRNCFIIAAVLQTDLAETEPRAVRVQAGTAT